MNNKYLYYILGAFSLLILSVGLLLWYQDQEYKKMLVPPKSPSNLEAKPLSAVQIELTWKDNSDNEIGFYLYRDNTKVADISKNKESYVDNQLRPATKYTYEIKAYNDAGESNIINYSVRTLNPPIIIWIDSIGVHESGEEGELLRDASLAGDGIGEIQVGFKVSDGKDTVEKSLPETDFYLLKKDQMIPVNYKLFESGEVGDYLRIYAVSYEDDGGSDEQMIYKVLDLATTSRFNIPTSVLLSLAGVDFSKIYGDLFGAEDDWMGSYSSEWKENENWGVKKYVDIQCKKGDGDIGLRLWFRIECPVYDYSSETKP